MVLKSVLPLLLVATAFGISARGAFAADTPVDESSGAAGNLAEELHEPTSLQGGSMARLLKPTPPKYPQAARRKSQEGWVVLSYSVSPNGTVIDPIVEDSSGVVEFERAAIASALNYKYEPATWNGKPIEQCATKIRFNFQIDGMQLGARHSFVKAYREIMDLTKEERIAEAEVKLEEMTAKGAWNNYEASRLWLMRATFQAAEGDKVGQLRSLRRAVAGNGTFLEAKMYRKALAAIFSLEVEQKHYGAALATHAKLKRLKATEDVELLDRIAAEIRAVIDGPTLLGTSGVVEYRSGCEEGRPNWQHELLRRKFTFDSIEGQVDDFELRCDWKRVVDKVSTERTWEIPESWGWCQVFVFGEIGAKAKIIEYPLADTPLADSLATRE